MTASGCRISFTRRTRAQRDKYMADKTTKRKEARTDDGVQSALLALEQMSTERDLDNLARFGITAARPFGVSMANLKVLAKRLGREPRARRRALGHRPLRGAHAGDTRRRAGARHARADGTLVPRLRQLGHLRHRVLRPLRSHAARVGQGHRVVRPARRVRKASGVCAPRLPRAARQGTPPTSRSSRACASSSRPLPTTGTS